MFSKKYKYDTVEVHIKGDSDCEHQWIEDKGYDNGNIKQIICKYCGQFETAVIVFEKEINETFDSLYKRFHEKIVPIEPIELNSNGIYDDYVSLVHIRGYLVDETKVNIDKADGVGLDIAQIGMEDPVHVVGITIGKSKTGVVDLGMEEMFGLSEEQVLLNDKEIEDKFLKMGYEKEHLEKLKIKSYVVGTYSY